MSSPLINLPSLRGWFIDPWRRTATPVRIEKKLPIWYKALDCETLNMARVSRSIYSGNSIDVWVDDCGSCRRPELPTFIVGGRRFWGYGLVFEGNKEGDTLSASFDGNFLAIDLALIFENWELRLNPQHHFEQMTRVIEWEPEWFHKDISPWPGTKKAGGISGE